MKLNSFLSNSGSIITLYILSVKTAHAIFWSGSLGKTFFHKFKISAWFFRKDVLVYPSLRKTTAYPGVAKFGIALEWGSRGLEFESRHSDQKEVKSFRFHFFFSIYDTFRICWNLNRIVRLNMCWINVFLLDSLLKNRYNKNTV